jgi:hypothetical protein
LGSTVAVKATPSQNQVIELTSRLVGFAFIVDGSRVLYAQRGHRTPGAGKLPALWLAAMRKYPQSWSHLQ